MLDAGLMGELPVAVIDALSSLAATMQLAVPAERQDALAVMFRTGLVLFLLMHMMVTVGSNARAAVHVACICSRIRHSSCVGCGAK